MNNITLRTKNPLPAVAYVAKLKRSELSLKKQVQELITHNEELKEFAYIVAHELKNPLSSMIGFASLIDQYSSQMSDDDIHENIRTTVEVGHQMKTIIDGLLLLTNMEAATDVEISSLNMAQILTQVTQSLSGLICEYHAHIWFPKNWPIARGYAPWVQEVWTNYISNAIKYGGSPPLIQIGAETTDNGDVHFWVEDNGRGLSEQEQQQLFRPFVRLRKHDAEGSGLGLTVVKKIMERLDGAILLESEVGKGSRFGFTLPSYLQTAESRISY